MVFGDKNSGGPWGQNPWGKKPEDKTSKETKASRPNNNQRNGDIPDFEEMARKFFERGKKAFPSGGNGDGNKKLWLYGGIAIFVLWLANGFYKVDPDEQAVVTRFGKFNRVASSGLNYRLPIPFEKVFTEKVTRVNRTEVGFRSATSRGKSGDILQESLMLTNDENIIDVNFEVQWSISKIEDFLFKLRDPVETVKSSAESAMREVIGRTKIASALAEGRLEVEQDTQQLLQHMLDLYGSGVQVVSVKMLKVDPPGEVIDAFRDVQTARADKERAQNEAESYNNDITPRARGEAERIKQQAEAYKKEVIAKAEGDASRFNAVYEKYKNAKDVTKKRMYLETMEQIMRGTSKIILDEGAKGSGIVPYLPLNELNKKPQAEAKQ